MTARSSQTLSQKLKPARSSNCKVCGLYLNQLPVFDEDTIQPHIFWVGLSAVQFNEKDEMLPLSSQTRSGALIEQIELPLRDQITFYKTNLVKCLPLKEGKIRYPSKKEMIKCFPNFEDELSYLHPSIVFLLGKQVASFVMKKYSDKEVSLCQNFDYSMTKSGNTIFVPVHHPSYILVYKRKFIDNYINSIRRICDSLL